MFYREGMQGSILFSGVAMVIYLSSASSTRT